MVLLRVRPDARLLTPEEDPLAGLSILRVDAETARVLTEADPAIRAGRFEIQVIPWMVPAGPCISLPPGSRTPRRRRAPRT